MKALLLIPLLFTGCLSTSPGAWNARADDARFQRDRFDCKQTANHEVKQGAAFGGAIVPLVALFTAPGLYRECMEARGWRQAE